MKAAVLREVGAPLSIEEVPTPEAGPGEVIVKVAAAGMCHSDLHIMDGSSPTFRLPHILGHEIAGWVHELGQGTDDAGFAAGDPVVVFGGWGCGHCRDCRAGNTQLCSVARWVGMGFDGGYAQYVRVPTTGYLLAAGDLDLTMAASLTDAGLTAYRAVRSSVGNLYPGSTAVLIGAGGLGQYGVQFLKLLTAAQVVVVDNSADKRQTALELGADAVIDGAAPDAADQIRSITGPRGAAAVLDFVGVDPTLALGLAVLGQSGRLVLIGIGGGSLPIAFYTLPMEASVTTSAWGNLNDLVEVLALAQAGKLVSRTQVYGLDQINDGFAELERGAVPGRAVLNPQL
ncbi:MAG: NAD(P)-dependent alcohol dehydrogenase [Beutenbergiaceae bacterium]